MLGRKKAPARLVPTIGTIGALEKRAGIADRASFWRSYASLGDGFRLGVAELKRIAAAREEKIARDAGWEQDEDGDWDHPDQEDAVFATAADVAAYLAQSA